MDFYFVDLSNAIEQLLHIPNFHNIFVSPYINDVTVRVVPWGFAIAHGWDRSSNSVKINDVYRLFRCKPHILFSCANRTVRDFGHILLWFNPKSKGTPFEVGKVSRPHFSFLTQPHVRFAQEKSVNGVCHCGDETGAVSDIWRNGKGGLNWGAWGWSVTSSCHGTLHSYCHILRCRLKKTCKS